MDFRWRVPLHPDDAAYNRKVYEDARADVSDIESAQRSLDLHRLAHVAAGARHAERMMRQGQYPGLSGREVDQEMAARDGVRFADRSGAAGRSMQLGYLGGLARAGEWASSEPESRHIGMQAMLVPEQALMHAMEALSSDGDVPRPTSETASRLAAAVPAAFFPEVGYPIQPAYDRLYRELGPIKGAFVDYAAMPGVDFIGRPALRGVERMRYGTGARTDLIDQAGDVIRRLRNSPQVRVEYAR